MFLNLILLTQSSANCIDQQRVYSAMDGFTEWFALDWKPPTLALVVVWPSVLLACRHRGLAADRGRAAVRQRATNRGRDLSRYRPVHTVELRGSACVHRQQRARQQNTPQRHHITINELNSGEF